MSDDATNMAEQKIPQEPLVIRAILNDLIKRYPSLLACGVQIKDAYVLLADCYRTKGKVLIAGNGGSCADAEHISGELMKGFFRKRPVDAKFAARLTAIDPDRGADLAGKLQQGLSAIPLNMQALSTAVINDIDGTMTFAQQVMGLGSIGDVFWGISTSGNALNVYNACITAKALGMKVLGLTGREGGDLKRIADVAIVVPEKETYKIQELHLPVYHTLCLMLEAVFFNS